MPGEYYGKEFIPIDTNEQGDFEVYLYGAEDFVVNEMQVWEGESDLNVIKDKLKQAIILCMQRRLPIKGSPKRPGPEPSG